MQRLGKLITTERRRELTGGAEPENALEEEFVLGLECGALLQLWRKVWEIRKKTPEQLIRKNYSNALNPDQVTSWTGLKELRKLEGYTSGLPRVMPAIKAKHLAEPALLLGLIKDRHPEFSSVRTRVGAVEGEVHVDLVFDGEVYDSCSGYHGGFGALEAYVKWLLESRHRKLDASRKARREAAREDLGRGEEDVFAGPGAPSWE